MSSRAQPTTRSAVLRTSSTSPSEPAGNIGEAVFVGRDSCSATDEIGNRFRLDFGDIPTSSCVLAAIVEHRVRDLVGKGLDGLSWRETLSDNDGAGEKLRGRIC